MKSSFGFTLIELVIVVTIILIIAAITIPCLTDSKLAANEASAVGSVRAIDAAEVGYQLAYGGYARVLANLGGPEPCKKSAATACLLGDSLGRGNKSGYNFVAVGDDPADGANMSYVVGAAPAVFDRSGRRRFCSTDKHVIRADPNTQGSTVPPDGLQCAAFSALQ
jgi:type IV pilus assembly protein PilA